MNIVHYLKSGDIVTATIADGHMTNIQRGYDPIAASKQRAKRETARHERLMAAMDRLKATAAKPVAAGHVSRFERGDTTYWRRRQNAMLRERVEARRCQK